MRKILTTALAVALTWVAASAVPAKPGVTRTVMQPDGTKLVLHLHGDEYHHALVTDDGLMVSQNSEGTYCYRTVNGVSDVMAHPASMRTPSELAFLAVNQQQADWQTTAGSAARAKRAKRNAERRKMGECGHSGNIKVPVLLVEYSDVKFVNSYDDIDTRYTSTTQNSAYRYYYENSDHKFVPQFDVYGPVKLSNNMEYYGGNDSSGNDLRPQYMVKEACELLNSDVDFSQYDNDGDGTVDVVIVVYAGGGEAQTGVENQVWPHQWDLASAGISASSRRFDNKYVNAYAVFNELNGDSETQLDGIGTFCHEFGHCLGLPDFYDIVYGNHFGMGDWDIMCGGSYNDDGNTPAGFTGYERDFMGWRTLETPTEGTNITLTSLQDGGKAYKVVNDKNSNEYYVLENRQKTNWDAALPARGMMVTHVDYNANFWDYNYVNCTTDPYSMGSTNKHQRMTIIPADNSLKMTSYQGSYYTVESDEVGDLFPYGGNNELTDSSTPAAKLYNNSSTDSNASSANYYMGKPITEITQNSDGTVSFWFVKGSTTPLDAPTLNDAGAVTTDGWTASWSAVTDAATYELQIDPASGGSSSGTEYVKVTSTSDLTSGQYLIVYENGGVAFDGSLETLDAASNTISVTISNNTIAASSTLNASAFTYDATAGTLKSASGYYIGATANSNSLNSSTSTAYTNTITFSDGNANIVGSGGAYLRYNASSGQERFRYYKSGSYSSQKAIQLYKLGGSSSSAPRRAGVTTKTITGITGTSYTVTGMADDQNYTFKVRAVPATTDTEHSTGDWSNVKTVKTVAADPEPLIMADETKSFNAFVEQSSTADVEIAYEDLSANITATITGDNASMFSCTSPITIDSSGDGYATLTVTYSPTAAGTHTATLTLASTGADPVTCTLTGTATLAPLDTYNPVMQDASGVSTSAFTATWTDQTDAEAIASYTLQISKKPETTTTTVNDIIDNSVTGITTSSYTDWTATGTSGASYSGNCAGTNTYVQLRSNNSNSGIVSTTSTGKIKKVTADWNSGTSDGRTLNVYGSNSAYTDASDLYDNDKQGTLLGTIVKGTSTELTISGDYAYIGVRSNSGAMYLNSITFTWEKTTTVGSVQRRRAVSDTGNADSGVRTITGITSKSYEVTGLTAGATYEYKVKAIYTNRAEAAESAWSNVMEVTLDDGPHTPTLAAEDLEFDGDNYVNGTYNKTLTVLGEYLSGDVTVTIAGEDAEMFSAPATIAASAFTGGEYALTVTYSPTTADVHSATLTLSSDGAEDVTVNLTGIADWQLFAPVMLVAQSVTSSSFKAVWTDETNASKVKSYTLWVNKTSGGDEPVASYKQLGDYSFASGVNSQWNKTSGYAAVNNTEGATQLGSGKQSCVLTSPSFNFTGYTKATIVVNAKYYGTDNSSMKLTLGSYSETFSLSDSYVDYVKVVDISGESDLSSLQATVECSASGKRIYLKNVTIYAGDASSALSAPRRVVATSGDADNGGLTVTGITDKFYTVEDLTAGATYEFKVKTVYSDDTESEWSNVEEVMLTEGSDPRLIVEPLALAFTNVTTGASAQQTFTVTGTNLTGDVTVAVGEGMFTVSPTTISAADAAEGATVTVTYAPTAFGNHTATVTLTSAGAEAVSVELSGSAVLEKAAPVMAEAVNATTTSFKAVWTDATPAANVRDYTLYVNKTADPVTPGDDPTPSLTALLTETFDGSTVSSDGTADVSNAMDDFADNEGWSGSYVYKAPSGVKLGSGNYAGSLTSPELDLSNSNGKVTVKINAYYYGSDASSVVIYSEESAQVTTELTENAADHIIVIDCAAAANQTVTFAGTAKKKRFYLNNIEIYTGDVSAQLAAAGAPRRVVATDGDADNGGLTVTGITAKEYTVTDLTPGATYEFYVEANYVDDTKSESNHEEVVLPAGTSLAEVLESESGSYTISDNLIIVAVLNNMAYATNGTDWLPIKVESGDNFKEGDKITLLNGTFNGSATAPQFTLTECGESTATITYSIADFYLGQDWTSEGNASAVWERMPAAGEVAKFYGYYFLENGVPTLRGYSGTTGTKEKGRSLILLGDNYGTLDLTEGTLYKVEVCVQLAEAWSGAPRRIASGDADAYQNLRGQVISTEDLTQTGIDDIIAAGDVQSVRYINAAGQMSSEPFAGLNIVVTTLTDGTVRVAKVLK